MHTDLESGFDCLRAITLGMVSSLFFAVAFVLNRTMSLSGGSWIWSASLRYLFMVPVLLVIVLYRRSFSDVMGELLQAPLKWVWWSFVGFGLFYAPLCIAAKFAPSWLLAASWQFTIIAGSLLSPLFREGQHSKRENRRRNQVPMRGLLMSGVIFCGIVVVELSHAHRTPVSDVLLSLLPVIVAAFAYPLGNRKMMELCDGRISAIERVFGMTVASLPLWIVLSLIGVGTVGLPSRGQVEQAAIVAICSGVIATVLFFSATDLTKGDVKRLAAVEATQSGEVIFTVILSMLFVSWHVPARWSLVGIFLIIIGMVGHSLMTRGLPVSDRENNAC